MEIGSDVGQLVAATHMLAEHLRGHDQDGWADALGRAAALLANGEAQGLYELQRMFGGMGSLNDVALNEGSGRLEELRETVFRLAQQMDRSRLRI